MRALALAVITVATVLAATVSAGAAAESLASSGAPASTASSSTASSSSSSAFTNAVSPADDRAIVTLSAVKPFIIKPGDAVTFTGEVTAPATGPLAKATVRLVQGSAPLMKRTDIDTWSAGTTAAPGTSLGSIDLPSVAPAQSVPFTITLAVGAVRSAAPFAALPMSLEVLQPGALEPIGVTRTFLPWNARKEYNRLQVATVVPITLDPDGDLFSRTPAVRDQAWAASIGPTSRVRRIIDGTKASAVTLAVDPSVFGTELTSNPNSSGAPGPQATEPSPTGSPSSSAPVSPSGSAPPTPAPTTTGTATPTGTTTPTASTDAATPPADDDAGTGVGTTIGALSKQLVSALSGRSLWALPYADADLAAAADIDPTNPLMRDLVDRSALVAASVGRPVRSDILWPVDGLFPSGREAALKTLVSGTRLKRPGAVVVDQRAITAASAYTPTARRVATDGTRLLAYDSRLSALLPQRKDTTGGRDTGKGVTTTANTVLPVQRYLAETLVLLGERAGTPRSVLVVAPRTFDPDPTDLAAFLSATASAPWLTTVDPASLVADAGTDRALPQQRPGANPPSAAPAPALSRPRLEQMATQRVTLRRVAGVLRDGDQFERTYREVLNELASVRWRYHRSAWPRLQTAVAADITAATSAIKVFAQQVNFFAQTGTLQITVENGLPYEVADIRLRLAPTNPRMQIDEQPGPITIAPDSKRVVKVPVTAVAAGQADIRAFLTTADGTPIGRAALIPVSANPIDARVYGIGGGLVVLVLVLGVARALRRGTSRMDEIGDAEVIGAGLVPEQREGKP